MARRKSNDYVSPITTIKEFIQNDRVKFGFSLLLILISVVMLIGFISYLFTWKEDQSKFELGFGQYFFNSDIQVENWGSKLGAWLAELFIHDWFGIPAFTFIGITALWGLRIQKYEPIPFWKFVKHSLIWTVWTSVFLAFLFGDQFFSLGGVFGFHVDYWLETVIGKFGTLFFLLIIAFTIITLTFENTLSWIKIFFADFKKHKNLKSAISNANTYAKAMTEAKKSQENVKSGKQSNKQKYDDDDDDLGNDNHTVFDEDENEMLNSPINSGAGPAEEEEKSNSIFSSIKDIFKGKDYKGKDQELDFDNKQQNQQSNPQKPNSDNSGKTVENKHYVLTDDGSELDFEVEDTTKNHDEIPTPEIQAQPLQAGSGLNDFTAQPVDSVAEPTEDNNPMSENTNETPAAPAESNGLALEVETNQDITATNIDNLPPYDPTLELSNYKLPPVELLNKYETAEEAVPKSELIENKTRIVEVLKNFKIKVDKIKATIGPTVTLYEIVPAPGIRISKIKNLEDDIQLSLKALGIRIIAPMPGKGTVGIEVPNKKPVIVSMESLITSVKFQESTAELPVAIGKTISNECYVMDLAKCPHLLVAGATGQGKSVGLNAIITSLLYKKHPSQLKFVLVDPKKVELTLYNNIEKHYLAKLPNNEEAIITDVDKVKETLNSLTVEMTNRYDMLKEAQCKNIKEYNAKFISRHLNPNNGHKYLPYIVVVIDEFADLIMTAGKDIEKPLARIAQLARAVGIHLIVATQRPTTNIITGLIKANFPTRIAFKVSSMMDSRTILDCSGANHLIGRGDMLISNGSDLTRLQCAFIDTPELEQITKFIGSQQGYPTTYELPEPDIESSDGSEPVDLSKRDGLFEEAARIIVMTQQGSTSMLQRKLEIGYNRAGRIMDQLEAAGIVGPNEGSKARTVNIDNEYTLEQFLSNLDRSL